MACNFGVKYSHLGYFPSAFYKPISSAEKTLLPAAVLTATPVVPSAPVVVTAPTSRELPIDDKSLRLRSVDNISVGDVVSLREGSVIKGFEERIEKIFHSAADGNVESMEYISLSENKLVIVWTERITESTTKMYTSIINIDECKLIPGKKKEINIHCSEKKPFSSLQNSFSLLKINDTMFIITCLESMMTDINYLTVLTCSVEEDVVKMGEFARINTTSVSFNKNNTKSIQTSVLSDSRTDRTGVAVICTYLSSTDNSIDSTIFIVKNDGSVATTDTNLNVSSSCNLNESRSFIQQITTSCFPHRMTIFLTETVDDISKPVIKQFIIDSTIEETKEEKRFDSIFCIKEDKHLYVDKLINHSTCNIASILCNFGETKTGVARDGTLYAFNGVNDNGNMKILIALEDKSREYDTEFCGVPLRLDIVETGEVRKLCLVYLDGDSMNMYLKSVLLEINLTSGDMKFHRPTTLGNTFVKNNVDNIILLPSKNRENNTIAYKIMWKKSRDLYNSSANVDLCKNIVQFIDKLSVPIGIAQEDGISGNIVKILTKGFFCLKKELIYGQLYFPNKKGDWDTTDTGFSNIKALAIDDKTLVIV